MQRLLQNIDYKYFNLLLCINSILFILLIVFTPIIKITFMFDFSTQFNENILSLYQLLDLSIENNLITLIDCLPILLMLIFVCILCVLMITKIFVNHFLINISVFILSFVTIILTTQDIAGFYMQRLTGITNYSYTYSVALYLLIGLILYSCFACYISFRFRKFIAVDNFNIKRYFKASK